MATLGHPLTFGYFLAIAIGFYLFLSTSIQNKYIRRIGFLILFLGLLAPLSRGPWIGAAALIIIFVLQGPGLIKKLSSMLVMVLLAWVILPFLPNGQKYLDLIPFVGKTETENIDYREGKDSCIKPFNLYSYHCLKRIMKPIQKNQYRYSSQKESNDFYRYANNLFKPGR